MRQPHYTTKTTKPPAYSGKTEIQGATYIVSVFGNGGCYSKPYIHEWQPLIPRMNYICEDSTFLILLFPQNLCYEAAP